MDGEPGWEVSMVLRRTNWLLRACMVEIKGRALADAIRAKYNFNPNQPRVPAGSSDGGQWTDAGGSGGSSIGDIGDSSGGTEVAQNVSRRPGAGQVRLSNGRLADATPAQAARHAIARAEADRLMREVQEIDPAWRRSQSLRAPDSVEGEIAEAEAWSREARSRLTELAGEPAESVIDAFRRSHGLDLFGEPNWSPRQNTVAHCRADDLIAVGVNSDAPSGYTLRDTFTAMDTRQVLAEKYPELMSAENSGQFPNDSLFHAEVTCLMRLARAAGGTLEGKVVEMRVDREMCWRCEKVLPKVGAEIGNPKVTVIDASGTSKTMHNGVWVK